MSKSIKEYSEENEAYSVPTSINLAPTSSMDISYLSEDERKALLLDFQNGLLDITKKAQELNVDSSALKKTLGDLSHTVQEVAENGNSVQVTHTQNTSIGRTEIIMGNTQQAQSGKLSRTQSGEKDFTPYYIFGVIIAIIIIAAVSR